MLTPMRGMVHLYGETIGQLGVSILKHSMKLPGSLTVLALDVLYLCFVITTSTRKNLQHTTTCRLSYG